MPIAAGFSQWLGFAEETTWGTPVSATDWHRIVSIDWANRGTQTVGNRGLGRLFRSKIRNRLKRASGSFALDLQYEGAERLFKHFFGGYSFATSTHTFTPSTTRQTGLTLEVNYSPVHKMTFAGAKLNSCAFAITNDVLGVTFSGTSEMGATSAAGSLPTFTAGNSPDICGLEESPGSLAVTMSGGAKDVTGIDIQMSLPHTEDREALGNDEMLEPVISDIMSVSGTVTRELEDTDFTSDFIADASNPMVITYTSATSGYSLVLTLADLIFGEVNQPIDGAGPVTESIPFVARGDGSGNFLTLALENTRATVA